MIWANQVRAGRCCSQVWLWACEIPIGHRGLVQSCDQGLVRSVTRTMWSPDLSAQCRNLKKCLESHARAFNCALNSTTSSSWSICNLKRSFRLSFYSFMNSVLKFWFASINVSVHVDFSWMTSYWRPFTCLLQCEISLKKQTVASKETPQLIFDVLINYFFEYDAL